jgi:hypothetical protein
MSSAPDRDHAEPTQRSDSQSGAEITPSRCISKGFRSGFYEGCQRDERDSLVGARATAEKARSEAGSIISAPLIAAAI